MYKLFRPVPRSVDPGPNLTTRDILPDGRNKRGRPTKEALTDPESWARFVYLVGSITGKSNPTRSDLAKMGKDAAGKVGRGRAWSGGHIYSLLQGGRYPQYKLCGDLLDALEILDGYKRLQDVKLDIPKQMVVTPGSHIYTPSRYCKECSSPFLPNTPNKLYCSVACYKKHRSKTRK